MYPTKSVVIDEFSASATSSKLLGEIGAERGKGLPEPVGFIVGATVWDHILYRADVLCEIMPDGSLHGFSGFLGLPVAVDHAVKSNIVEIVFDAGTWSERMKRSRLVTQTSARQVSSFNMVRHVAQAIKNRSDQSVEDPGWSELARAALKAMRQPTEKMLAAGGEAIPSDGMRPEHDAIMAAEVWRDMIEAALLE